MIDPQVIQTLIEYHYGRYRDVWRSIMTLSDEQFVAAVPYSWGSVRNQMVHVMDDDAKWIAFLRERRAYRALDPADFATRAAARAHYDTLEADHLAFVEHLDEVTLQKIYWWDTPLAIVPQQVTGWHVLLHIVNHGTDHRAQILRALHDLGAPTFDQDFMRYLWQAGHINPLSSGNEPDV